MPQTIPVFLNTDIQKSMLDVPNPPSAAFPWKQQQPSPGCSHTLSCVSRSPVSPCTRGKHTVQSTCAAGAVKINSRRKAGGDFMSTSQRHELLPPTCPAATAGGDTGPQPVASGKSVSPQLLGWREKVVLYLGYCPSWGSFIFSAVDMATVCLGIVSQCWLLSCTAMRSRVWALPLNFPSFPGIIFYL